MSDNCQGSQKTVCAPCTNGFFTDDYNNNYNWCDHCKMCTKDRMSTRFLSDHKTGVLRIMCSESSDESV